MSEALRGIGVSPGTASGPAVFYRTEIIEVPRQEDKLDVAVAEQRVADALEQVALSLEERANRAAPEAREVLEATAMIARDPGLIDGTRTFLVDRGFGPVRALNAAIEEYCAMLTDIGGYMAERVTDLRDVFQRAAARLLGRPEPGLPRITEPIVLVAEDLAPADTATLDPALVRGIITAAGGPTSHTAILAAQLGIPAVVKVAGAMALPAGTTLGLDGGSGDVYVNPDEAQVASLAERAERRAAAQQHAGGPGRTKDGHPVQVLANIGTLDDALKAAAYDVEGVGLFRTEFLFMDRDAPPSLAEQTETYTRIFEAFGSRKVVVRTLDGGADKPLLFADLGAEENPALGVRGLRLQREVENLLSIQLQALAAAAEATSTPVWVMAPMVATEEEAEWFAAQVHTAGLRDAGTMIEVPAAAVRSAKVLRPCSFASIGTNDLSQYTFASDRMDGRLAHLLTGWQPALWDLIVATVDGGRANEIPVGICGEVGGDPLLACVAAGAGITSLSMAPGKAAAVKAALAMHTLEQCQSMLAALRDSYGPVEAKAAVLAVADPAMADLL